MSIKPLLFSSLFILPVAAQADFQWEIDAESVSKKIDYDIKTIDDTSYDEGGIQGKYYFSAVSVEQNPVREAAFLGKQSNVSVQYFMSEQTKPSKAKHELSNVLIDGDIRLSQSALRVGGFVGLVDEEFSAGDYSAFLFGGRFGWHIQDNSLLSFTASIESGEEDAFGIDIDIVTSKIGVKYKQVFTLANSHLAVGAGLDASTINVENVLDDDDDFYDTSSEVELFLTWYVIPQLGLGIEINSFANNYDDDRPTKGGDASRYGMLSLTASYDINEVFGLNLAVGQGHGLYDYDNSSIDDEDSDRATFNLGLQARF